MRQLDLKAGTLIFACILGGAACIAGAVQQTRTGETRGLVGGRVAQDEQPVFFWFLFWSRMVLGVAALRWVFSRSRNRHPTRDADYAGSGSALAFGRPAMDHAIVGLDFAGRKFRL